jgi:hypothetical protein
VSITTTSIGRSAAGHVMILRVLASIMGNHGSVRFTSSLRGGSHPGGASSDIRQISAGLGRYSRTPDAFAIFNPKAVNQMPATPQSRINQESSKFCADKKFLHNQ